MHFLWKIYYLHKLSRSAFFDYEKCLPNKTHPTTTANSAPPPSDPHTTTLEIIQAYYKQITPRPPWGSIKKIHPSLKIQFQVGSVLYKIENFSKKITPLQPLLIQHTQLRIWALNQKSASNPRGGGGSNQKNKKYASLKIYFQEGSVL